MSADVMQWQRLPIGRIALPRLGGNYRNSASVTTRPLIKMGNIARVRIALSRLDYIHGSEQVDPVHRLHTGDVLFNTRNTLDLVGKVSIWRDELPLAYYNSNILRLEFKPEYCGDSRYFGYALNSEESISAIRNLATGTTSVAAVYTRDLLKLEISVPCKEEQRAIAATLDDADQLLTALERMIAKKQAIKQGMVQQLMTRRIRLSGFSGPWIETTWGELTSQCSSGATPLRSRSEFWGEGIPWVTSTELKYGIVARAPQSITPAGFVAANLTLWPVGTFLMAITGLEAAGTRGSCGILGIPATTNQSCMAIIPNARLESRFLYHYYVFRGNDLALRYCQGTKQQSYTAAIVRTLPIYLPEDVEEQRAIARVLDHADAEIELLQERLQKARRIKHGMMQELLTGRTRLPVREAVA